MSKVRILREDEIRDGWTDDIEFHKGAKQLLGFDIPEKNVKQGTGQIYTFKQLGFECEKNNHKPDGWYLPDDTNEVAIILETKSEDEDLTNQNWVDELFTNIDVVATKYDKVVGILYNGKEQRIYLNKEEYLNKPTILEHKKFYTDLFNNQSIDKQKVYTNTKRINDLLHFSFGVTDYYDRMVFTACALVAKRYGAPLSKGMDYPLLHFTILNTLNKSLEEAKKQNAKLEILLETYSNVKMNITDNQEAIDEFIVCVNNISDLINSKYWNGEDVMGIFFNEFNRYKGKSDNGQVFTPEHITSLMYRIIGVNMNDRVLDATCGSGAFLTKSMANMINEAGGPTTKKAKEIMSKQLFGIEIDKRVFSLACANMLIHKDGKTNLEQLDATSQEACDWIKSKKITKVLMNPPYEKKYKPDVIVKNVLDNCEKGCIAAFLLPNTKLEKFSKSWRKDVLAKHTLLKIVKLPSKTFDEGTGDVSVFVFECGKPQNDAEIFTCYIEEDGLERVKNQGRQDIKHRWKGIEDEWIKVIKRQSGDNSIKWNAKDNLKYIDDEKPFTISEEDFKKTAINFICFQQGIDTKEFGDKLLNTALYASEVSSNDTGVSIKIGK